MKAILLRQYFQITILSLVKLVSFFLKVSAELAVHAVPRLQPKVPVKNALGGKMQTALMILI